MSVGASGAGGRWGVGGLFAAAGWIDDRVNPIVVKEARQAVRSRFVVVVYLLLLMGLVTASAVVMLLGTIGVGDGAGAVMFGSLNAAVLGVCVLVTPVVSAVRLSTERKGPRADLMNTTTIGPVSVVMGKLVVAVMIALLFFSAAAPFMMVTYLFRGIDLATIGFTLVLDVVALVAAAQVGVMIAAVPMSRALQVLAGIFLLPSCLYVLAGAAALVLPFSSGGSVASFDADDWVALAVVLVLAVDAVGVLFALSVSLTAQETDNRAVWPRLYLAGSWVLTLAAAVWGSVESSSMDPLTAWTGFWCCVWAVSASLAVGERRRPGKRVLRRLHTRRIGRAVRVLWTSGAASGLVYTLLMVLLTFGVAALLEPVMPLVVLSSSGAHPAWLDANPLWEARAFVPIPLFMLGYALWGGVLRDLLMRRWTKPAVSIAIAWLLAAVCSLGPGIAAFMLSPRDWESYDWPLYLNPAGVLFFSSSEPFAWRMLWISSLFCAGSLALCSGWVYSGLRSYGRAGTSGVEPTAERDAPGAAGRGVA
ncbi:MAG: hypothetical protein AAF108_06515 [Planctomycetota bacterium]